MTGGGAQKGRFQSFGDGRADVPQQHRQSGEDERGNRKGHVRGEVAELLESRQTFKSERNHAARWKPTRPHRHNQQAERKHEVGDHEKRRGGPREDSVGSAAESCRAPDSERKGQKPRKKSCRSREDQGVSRANPEQRSHGTVIGKRKSQISVGNGIEPVRIPDGQWTIQLVLRAQSRDRFRRDLRAEAHFIEIVSSSQCGKKKREKGYAEEEKECVKDSAEQVAHQPFTSAPGGSRNRGVAARSERVAS